MTDPTRFKIQIGSWNQKRIPGCIVVDVSCRYPGPIFWNKIDLTFRAKRGLTNRDSKGWKNTISFTPDSWKLSAVGQDRIDLSMHEYISALEKLEKNG